MLTFLDANDSNSMNPVIESVIKSSVTERVTYG